MAENKYSVAIYCRVAQADLLALNNQKNHLIDYAINNGFRDDNIVAYMDNGYSGLNFDRPAFSRMEQDIQTGVVRSVIVKDISRIGRNMFEAYQWIEQLRKNKTILLLSDIPLAENFSFNRNNYILHEL